MMEKDNQSIRDKTIKDFGEQFDKFSSFENDKYWADLDHLKDLLGNTFSFLEIKDKIIAEIGCGNGRIVHMLQKLNPSKTHVVEPSKSIEIVKKNNINYHNINYHNIDGANFMLEEKCDYIFSLGVIHHIKKPDDVIKNIFYHLKEKGIFVCSVYAKEKNTVLIFLLKILGFTKKIDDKYVFMLSFFFNTMLVPYAYLCKVLPFELPMKKYLIERFMKNNFKNRTHIIFDQLNPEYAKFYKKEEICELIEKNGFTVEQTYDSAGNNWAVRAIKK